MGTVIPENLAAFEIDDFVRCVGGELLHRGRADRVVGVSTDSRRVRAGNAFVALAGERFDGHDHAPSAGASGAAALLVSREIGPLGDAAVVRVADTLEALGLLAREHRRRWGATARAAGLPGKVIGITGSAGKTTTCRATTAVLDALGSGAVHAPVGNLNNAIGMPLVLLGLEPRHGLAVVEIGTNSPGEIAYGARMTEPDVGLLTLVACAHTEGLGSIEAVAQEKGALFESIGTQGVCVANADDPLVLDQAKRSDARLITFGTAPRADVRVIDVVDRGFEGQTIRVEARVPGAVQQLEVTVPLLGAAGVYATASALAAAWATHGDRVDLPAAAEALSRMRAESGRLRPRTLKRGPVLIDDAYNANPASMRDSIEVAAKIANGLGRRLVLVLGEMRELGVHSEREHRLVGEQLAALRPGCTIAVGGDAKHFADAVSTAGLPASFAPDASAAEERLFQVIDEADVVLIKGSRGVALERVVAALVGWGEGQDR